MNLRIRLAILNDRGAAVSLETKSEDWIILCENRNRKDGKGMCIKAAKMLREAADRFDELAKQEDPFKGATQDKINRVKARKAKS